MIALLSNLLFYRDNIATVEDAEKIKACMPSQNQCYNGIHYKPKLSRQTKTPLRTIQVYYKYKVQLSFVESLSITF